MVAGCVSVISVVSVSQLNDDRGVPAQSDFCISELRVVVARCVSMVLVVSVTELNDRRV